MKIYTVCKFFFVAILIFTINACKKDNSEKNLLLGKWDLQKTYTVVTTNGERSGGTCCSAAEYYWQFKNNGEGFIDYKGFNVDDEAFTYVQEGDKITIDTGSPQKIPFKIKTLDKNNLTLLYHETKIAPVGTIVTEVTREFKRN